MAENYNVWCKTSSETQLGSDLEYCPLKALLSLSFLWGEISESSGRVMRVEEVRKAYIQSGNRGDSCCPLSSPHLLFSVSTSPLFSSNPCPLKTSRHPPLIMTRLSNPIAVAQTQGSALNPLVSDCFSRVKWLCPPCHSPGHRHRRPGCQELLRREPSHRPPSLWPHTCNEEEVGT